VNKEKPRHLVRGVEAEDAVVNWLFAKGFKIIERNVRFKVGEIDIIAWERDILCFIEVRSRDIKSTYHPSETVGIKKQHNLIRAAQLYLKANMRVLPRCRFDIASVRGYGELMQIDYIRNAFEAERAARSRRGSPWQGY
jgi:putative endonuclease